ncbi:hypothetical protein WMY93_025174 [Mugilogobius chulae]|uniref:Sec1 family domain-containing protein 2 n=1 Tax=Mugilogobius chulae TaxID=88201 RepID=A0AAW0N639_9GOBI
MFTVEDYTQFPLQTWKKVFSKVKKAVVFMDDRCAEALHWTGGGAAALFEAGAKNLKQFSSFEACRADEPKAVFVVSTLLKGRTVDIIKDIISLSHFQYCVVITSVAHSVHLVANNVTAEMDGNPVFEQFEEKLSVNSHSTVCSFVPSSPPDLDSINAKRPEKKRFGNLVDVDVNSLPAELQIEIKNLASALNSMFETTGTREESFAVGPMSRLIAGELANHPQAKNRRKSAQKKASIIFIDRTMDLTGAVGRHGDSLVEKILTVLKPLPGHVTDVQVDMLELTTLQRSPQTKNILAPGCLAQSETASISLQYSVFTELQFVSTRQEGAIYWWHLLEGTGHRRMYGSVLNSDLSSSTVFTLLTRSVWEKKCVSSRVQLNMSLCPSCHMFHSSSHCYVVQRRKAFKREEELCGQGCPVVCLTSVTLSVWEWWTKRRWKCCSEVRGRPEVGVFISEHMARFSFSVLR